MTNQELINEIRSLLSKLEAQLQSPTTPSADTRLAWGAKVSSVFRDRILWTAEEIRINPNWLMACMAFETGRTFSPSVKNPGSSATGLIQFMAATAKNLGTSTEALRLMTAEDQIRWVYEYFKPYAGKLNSLEDTYMAILYPKGIGQPLDYRLFVEGDRNYFANRGLDTNRDGSVSKAEAAAKVVAMLAEGLREENVA